MNTGNTVSDFKHFINGNLFSFPEKSVIEKKCRSFSIRQLNAENSNRFITQ